MNDAQRLAALRRCPLFADLDARALEALAAEAVHLRAAPGKPLFQAGEPAVALMVIVEGRVELSLADAQGEARTLDLLGAGECLGEDCLVEGSPHGVTARAVVPTTVLRFDAERLLDCLGQRFDVVLGLLAGMSARLRTLVQEITLLKMSNTTERLGAYLLSLAGGGAEGGVTVRLPLDKAALAVKLGMQPESLSRAFARLREHGVATVAGDQIAIADVDLLRERYQPDSY